jgi:hypothetical protein
MRAEKVSIAGRKIRGAWASACVACAVLASSASSTLAAAWSPAAGLTGAIAYANGQDLNGNFGNPIVVDQTFLFSSPSAFNAASPGVPASTTDTTSASLVALGGLTIQKVSARVEGDFSFNESPAQLTYSATLIVDDGFNPVIALPLTFVPASPISSGNGTFIGTGEIALPAGIIAADVSLTASVAATSTAPGTTEIQIKSASFDVTTIPEPAALGVLGLAGAALLRRMRVAR